MHACVYQVLYREYTQYAEYESDDFGGHGYHAQPEHMRDHFPAAANPPRQVSDAANRAVLRNVEPSYYQHSDFDSQHQFEHESGILGFVACFVRYRNTNSLVGRRYLDTTSSITHVYR